MKVYISGALTNVSKPEKIKEFYEDIGNICKDLKINPYIPHLNTDPIKDKDIIATKVFEIDKKQVLDSDLVIAYIGEPSLGVGMEVAYAEVNNIPIIFLYEKNKSVSRFPLGVPNKILSIEFISFEQTIKELRCFLEDWISNKT